MLECDRHGITPVIDIILQRIIKLHQLSKGEWSPKLKGQDGTEVQWGSNISLAQLLPLSLMELILIVDILKGLLTLMSSLYSQMVILFCLDCVT